MPSAVMLDPPPRADSVVNVHRARGGADAPVAAFTPRTLGEHAHPTLQVSVLLRETIAGVGWHTGGGSGAARRLRGGQTYVVPSEQPHSFRLHRPQGMVNFHIDRDALVALSPAHFETGLADEVAVLDDALVAGLAAGVHAAATAASDALTPLYIDAAWTMLALHLAARRHDALRRLRGDRLPAPRLARVRDCVEARLGDAGLRVADLAAVAGMSPVHFTRVFAQAVGASPMQYVIGRRLERARELLARGEGPIAAVALAVGFGSHARLTEAFRRRYGMPPSALRGRR